MKTNTHQRTNTARALLAGVVLLSVGCAHQPHEPANGIGQAIQIRSTVSREGTSKSLVDQTTALSAVRFLKLDATQPPLSMDGATPFLGNRAADGSIVWQGTEPLYDPTGHNAYLVAYHPSADETSATQVDWAIDGKSDLLLSTPWDAGTVTAPQTGLDGTPLTFNHVLAQLAVVIKAKAGANLNQVQAKYGKITGVKLVGTRPTATYAYASNSVTFSGTTVDLPLFQADCQTDFTAVDIPASADGSVLAGGLFAPSTGAFTLLVSTEQYPSLPAISVQLTGAGEDQDFEAGKKHIVTLTLSVVQAGLSVSEATIVDWADEYVANTEVKI